MKTGGDCKTLTNDQCRFCYVHPDSGCDDVAESKIGSKFDLSCQACTESEATYAGNRVCIYTFKVPKKVKLFAQGSDALWLS